MNYLISLIKTKKLKKYLKVIVIPKHKFIKAYRKRKTHLEYFPYDRCLGKTKLIKKYAQKYKRKIITKYHYYSNPLYIRENVGLYHPKDGEKETIYFVDGISKKTAEQLTRRGIILIGYIQ